MFINYLINSLTIESICIKDNRNNVECIGCIFLGSVSPFSGEMNNTWFANNKTNEWNSILLHINMINRLLYLLYIDRRQQWTKITSCWCNRLLLLLDIRLSEMRIVPWTLFYPLNKPEPFLYLSLTYILSLAQFKIYFTLCIRQFIFHPINTCQ